jgi:outer membrane protein assembly factor BamB
VKQAAGQAWRLLLLVALGLSGCETLQSGANPQRPMWVHRPIGSLRVLVRRPLTAPAKVKGEEYERGRPEIDAERHRVFLGSSDHGLYAISSDTGETIWRFETLAPVQCEPMYDEVEQTVYFGSNDGALYKVAAIDGRLLWRFMSNAEVSRKPVLSKGTLYAVNANDTLLAIDPASGKLRWMQHRTPAMGMEMSGYAGPLVMGNTVFVAFSDGNVAAFNVRDGSETWPPVDLSAEAEQTLGEMPKYLDVDTTPVPGVVGGGPVIYVASYAGGVFALDALTGNRVWGNTDAAGVTDLVLWTEPAHAPRDGQGPREPARSLLLASSGATGLWALSPDDGRQIWRRSLPEGGISAPVPVAGAVLVSTTRFGLHLFSPLDGGIMDGIDMSGGLSMTPAVKGHRAYVLSNAGMLLGLYVDPPRQPVETWQAL